MTTILHLSDLHFGHPMVPAQIESIERLIQSRGFDVIAISGDLTQRARAGEFQRAQAFIRDAQRVSRTIVVPGNHDVKWWWAPLGVGESERIFEPYRTWIAADLEPVLHVPGATFVGLNTAHGVTGDTLTWNVRQWSVIGALTRPQLDRARAELREVPPHDARVIVMHHNPVKGELSGRHGLRNTARILGAFADMGVDLVLCGHDHQEAVHYIQHTKKGTIISTAGTVSSRSRGGRPSSLNLITITPDRIEVATSIWSEAGHHFGPGPCKTFAR